jgi:hypothetical protein
LKPFFSTENCESLEENGTKQTELEMDFYIITILEIITIETTITTGIRLNTTEVALNT